MLKKNEMKSTLKLVLPLIAAFLAQKGMQFIDTYMMGWLGPDALAAGAIGTTLFIVIIVFCMGTLSAVGVFISRAKGANDPNDIKSNLLHGICLAGFLSLPGMLFLWLIPHSLSLVGQNQQVVENTALLLHGLAWGIPGFLLFLIFREFISAFSLTRIVMITAVSAIPLTFFANYILIYGKIGLPKLGIAGIGFAGAAIEWFMFLCLLIYSLKTPLLKEYMSFKQFKFSSNKVIEMLYIGVPSGSLFIFESGMFLSATLMMGHFGVDSLAAYQIAFQWANVAYSIPFALSMATALQVGHAMGAKEIFRVKRIAFFNLGLALLFSGAMAALFVFFPDYFVKPFLNKAEYHYAEIYQLSTLFLILAAIFQCFDAVQTIANGALRGLKDTFVPMLLSIGCYWFIGVFCTYYLAFHTSLAAKGIWYGLTLGLLSAGIALLIRLLNKLAKLVL